jgi:hypothetical protein
VASPHHLRRQHERPTIERLLDGEDGRQVLVLDDSEVRRLAREAGALGRDREERLAPVLDDASAKTGSPGRTGPTSFDAGRSRAVMTAATPATAVAAPTSSRMTRACARSESRT